MHLYKTVVQGNKQYSLSMQSSHISPMQRISRCFTLWKFIVKSSYLSVGLLVAPIWLELYTSWREPEVVVKYSLIRYYNYVINICVIEQGIEALACACEFRLRLRLVTTTSIIFSSDKIQNGDILVPDHPVCPEKNGP